MPKTNLNLTLSLAASTFPVTGYQRLVYALVEITGGEGADSLPSNLSFLLDTSDSMRIRLVTDEQFVELAKNGLAQEVMTDGVPAYQIKSVSNDIISQFPRRIDYVSQALILAGEFMRPVDTFSVVAYASRSQVLIPPTLGKEKQRLQQAARELEYLKLGDETHLAEGMALALRELQQAEGTQFAPRLIVLSDGYTRNVKDCFELARQARKSGIKLTTMGIGIDFNEELLISLADITGGNAYYIETPDRIIEGFRKELGAALRISYRNLEVKVLLAQGVELRRVHRVLPELSDFDKGPGQENSYSLWLGDYDPSAPQTLLLELVIPPLAAGSHPVAQMMLVWDDPKGGKLRETRRSQLNVALSNHATAFIDERVLNIVEKVGAYRLGTKALEAAQNAALSADQNERSSATLRLRQAATQLLNMGEESLADSMLQQAEHFQQSGQIDPEGTKQLRYATRRMTQRL